MANYKKSGSIMVDPYPMHNTYRTVAGALVPTREPVGREQPMAYRNPTTDAMQIRANAVKSRVAAFIAKAQRNG